MARALRIEFAGAIYHVIARGNARAPIFIDDHDRRLFLFELARVAERLNWWLWAYCLMGNHYHLVLETVQPTLARGMREEGYLPQVIRYVLMNPVRAGLVARPDDWYWSSFLATAGTADVPPRLAVQRVRALFDPDPNRARRTFAGLFSTDSPPIEWPTPVRNRAGAYTLHAIAEHFGLHDTTVSQIVHQHPKLAIQDLTP